MQTYFPPATFGAITIPSCSRAPSCSSAADAIAMEAFPNAVMMKRVRLVTSTDMVPEDEETVSFSGVRCNAWNEIQRISSNEASEVKKVKERNCLTHEYGETASQQRLKAVKASARIPETEQVLS